MMELNERLVNKLIELNYKITFAESCTGGLVASKIVEVSNASKVFDQSFVTYSNESKVNLLGVNEETINKYGVVSENVAVEMAKGCALKAHANIGVGISGIAGPTGDTPTKPIGMVCFGFYINGEVSFKTMYFGNVGRNVVRNHATKFVLEYLLHRLGE